MAMGFFMANPKTEPFSSIYSQGAEKESTAEVRRRSCANGNSVITFSVIVDCAAGAYLSGM